MASTSQKPKKGILKHSGSIDHSKKEIEWDEMNILATYHPPGKDYGHMKVEEPPTPYNRAAIVDNDEETGQDRKGSICSVGELDPAQLAERLEFGGDTDVDKHYYQDDDDDDAEHENETDEEKKRRKAFLLKRKMHYNEFAAVQLAKKLMAEDEDDDEEEGPKPDSSSVGTDLSSNLGQVVSSVESNDSKDTDKTEGTELTDYSSK